MAAAANAAPANGGRVAGNLWHGSFAAETYIVILILAKPQSVAMWRIDVGGVKLQMVDLAIKTRPRQVNLVIPLSSVLKWNDHSLCRSQEIKSPHECRFRTCYQVETSLYLIDDHVLDMMGVVHILPP